MATDELAQHITQIVHNNLGDIDIPIVFDKPKSANLEGTYVFSDNEMYHYVFIERGKVGFYNRYTKLVDIYYAVIKDLIAPIAKDYEFKNRNRGQDFRRIWFSKELVLWALFGEELYNKAKREIDAIILNHPYVDE